MSRTNPNKKKRRSASKTVLIYGEGLAEETFFKYLKGVYSFNNNVVITIRRGKGGTADGITMQTFRVQGSFSQRFVVLDNDKGKREIEKARRLAEEKAINLLENTPCLEALLLSILSERKSFSHKTSSWCKKEFESKYIDSKKRGDIDCYRKLFTKKLLKEMRNKISELETLICIFEGK